MNLCEVDVFEDYLPCDEPGSVAYEDGETKILLCVNHATELASAKGSQ